jgi:hypothetical protein
VTNPEDIRSAIRRLIAGTGTDNDRGLLQSAYLEGRVVNLDGERNIGAGGDMVGNIIITGDVTVKNEYSLESLNKLQAEVFPTPLGIAPPFPHLVFVGRDTAVTDVKKKLGVINEGASLPQLIVRGWPGVGKTTLVSVLARDVDVARAYPDGILWTALEKKEMSEIVSIMAGWGRFLGRQDLLAVPSPDEVAQQISALLYNKRMLLIVDDVWDAGHGALFQRAQAKNCGLLFTTRLDKVAEGLAQTDEEVYTLPVLTEDDSVKLMRILAPKVVNQHEDKCRELINDLERLPLAIQVAARLLRREMKRGWGIEDLIEEIKEGAKILEAEAPPDRAENGEIPTVQALLKRSTDMLSEEMREYFASLGVFPEKPTTFDEQAIRYVLEVEDAKPIINELLDYGLLEINENNRFQMHALLRAHARSLCT